MNKYDIEKWINKAKLNESITYFTGHLGEDRELDLDHKKEIKEMANAFIKAAGQKKIDLFQKKIEEGDLKKEAKPIYEYIARKLKSKKFNLKIEDSFK